MRLKGPELRKPDVKVPAVLADLYFDLRDRRLLPLVALVVVAIAAVPFLLGDDAEELTAPPLPAELTEGTGTGGYDASTFAVVQAKPGLRDYKKRLKGRTPTDPFRQKFVPSIGGSGTAEASSGSGSGSDGDETITETKTETTTTTVEKTPGGGGDRGSGTGDGKGNAPVDQGTRYFAFRPDVRFGRAGSGKLKAYPELGLGSRLPARNPVVVFMGISENGKRVAFYVSPEVALVRGDGECVGGHTSCSLLTLKVGQAVDLLTDKPNRTFRLAVDAIKFVEVDRPKPAKTSAALHGSSLDLSQSFSK
jgi:hypothetical protein